MTPIVANRAEADAIRAAIPGAAVVDARDASNLPLGPLVIWLERLAEADLALLEPFLAPRGRIDIAVSPSRCDGFVQPPLAALCRGLVAGFGLDGLRAAIQLLESRTV